MDWRHPIESFWQRLGTQIRAEVAPLVAATEARLVTAAATAGREALAHFDDRLAIMSEQADHLAALHLARWEAVDRRLDDVLNRADAAITRLDAVLAGTTAVKGAVTGAEERLGERFDAAVAEGIATLGSGPGTMLGAKLTAWMGSPGWEAARYAVQKSDQDKSLTDNAIRHQQALEWAKRWLRTNGHPVPEDRMLNLLIELVLVERKGLEAVR